MTPCEERGWKIGDQFRVVGNNKLKHQFSTGDIVELMHDDGSNFPRFITSLGGHPQWVSIGDVEKLTGPQWTTWGGGHRPVTPDTRVSVLLRNGEIMENVASLFVWNHYGANADIMGYRLADEESDTPTQEPTQDPIATIKAAREKYDAAEREYRAALEAARKEMGDGFILTDTF